MIEGLADILVGKSEAHLVAWRESGLRIHRDMREALENLARAAQVDGIQLALASAYRSFERQVAIWNAKALGERTLLDAAGKPLDFRFLSDNEILEAILRWSALPGASRHHWGTDIDVYDASVVGPDYQVQLTVKESRETFSRLHSWLDDHLQGSDFFRPYRQDLGGIAPEPWHISYGPISNSYFESYSKAFSLLEHTIRDCEMALRDKVMESLPQIFERYFLRISKP